MRNCKCSQGRWEKKRKLFLWSRFWMIMGMGLIVVFIATWAMFDWSLRLQTFLIAEGTTFLVAIGIGFSDDDAEYKEVWVKQ